MADIQQGQESDERWSSSLATDDDQSGEETPLSPVEGQIEPQVEPEAPDQPETVDNPELEVPAQTDVDVKATRAEDEAMNVQPERPPGRPPSTDPERRVTSRPSTAKHVSFVEYGEHTISQTAETPTVQPAQSAEFDRVPRPPSPSSQHQTDSVIENDKVVATPTLDAGVVTGMATPVEKVDLEGAGDETVSETDSPLKSVSKDEKERSQALYDDQGSSIPSIAPDFKPDFSAFEGINMEEHEEQDVHLSESETQAIQGLLDELEDGQSDLESDIPPPPLFSRPEHRLHREKIDDLKMQMSDPRPMGEYLDEFEQDVKNDVLMIGNISLEDIQEEERRLRDEHIAYQKQEAQVQKEQLQELLHKEEQAKKEVSRVAKAKKKAIEKQEVMNLQKGRLQHDMLQKSYRRAEQQMLATLKRRKAEVKTMYGDLEMADGQYGGSKGRRWKVDWSRTPQPIQIKLKCLRAIKDKLPAGRYVLMVSLYDRLGGHVLRWSELKGQQWGGACLPVQHDGQYHSIELKVDQSVFTVCPAKPDIRPGMVLTFELFILRGAISPTDRVVGWGTFPISDAEFNIIEGKYKCCMLRGDIDPSIDKHEKLEELMACDLENWLCNLYFEVIKLPRYLAGQKEYEVELQFTSGLLGFPDRLGDSESAVDGNDPVLEEREEAEVALAGSSSSVSGSSIQEAQLRLRTAATAQRGSHSKLRPETSVHQSRKMLEGGESSDSDDELLGDDDEPDFMEQNGQPGLYYKLHTRNPADRYYKQVYTMLPKTAMLKKKKKKALSHLDDLENHSVSVKAPFSAKGRAEKRSTEKIQYIGRQLLAEMGFSQWRSREFWSMIIMLLIVFWMRLYLHYIGQWLFLNAIRIPVNKFEFLAYTVFLKYQSSLLFTREEFAVVVIGPMSNVVIFSLLIMMVWAAQRVFGSFPNILSRFVVAFGIEAALDPILITIVDMAMGRYKNREGIEPIADAAKLYWHFFRLEGNGLAGIFLTLFVYFFIVFVAVACLYMYFLKLHMNGRMLDIYHRLHGNEDDFFVPYDLELSNEELSYIVQKAEQWRGEEGERRKTAVYDYVWEEEQVVKDGNPTGQQGRREITSHVSIHTIHLDGLRQLFRHFLRLPDGAIVEVFGDLGSVGRSNLDNKLRSQLQTVEGSRDQLFTASSTVRGFRPSKSPSQGSMTEVVRPTTAFLTIPEQKYGEGATASPV